MNYRSVASVLAVLLTLSLAGCATTAPIATSATPVAAVESPVKPEAPKQIPQDPALRITTAEVKDLFAQEYGDKPLIKEVLEKNSKFLLVDVRPKVKFEEGHVPGAISIPTPLLEQNLDKLPKDRQIIFYCGGLACPLSPEAAEIAKKNGFTNIRVWYEGEPQWVKDGNYVIAETPFVKRMMDNSDKETFLLVDARPPLVHKKSFIPGSVSIPKVLFEQKRGLLPADKNTLVIVYCGGHQCELSHQVAKEALQLGYSKVRVYSAGTPEWGKQNLAMWGNEASGIVEAPKAVAAGALPETISPEDFKKAVAAGQAILIDVRGEREFNDGHLKGAIHIADGDFYKDFAAALKKVPTDKHVILYCSTGARAAGVFFAITDDPNVYKNPLGLQYLKQGVVVAKDGTFTIE